MTGKIAILAGCASLLAACTACPVSEPRTVVQTVTVPVAASCVSDAVPGAPAYPDTDAALTAAGVSGPRRYQLVVAGRALRSARLAVLERVLADCRAAGRQIPAAGTAQGAVGQ